MYEYKAKIINVVDGDTVDATVDVGFKMTTVQRLRLLSINTAELTSKDPVERAAALAAKLYLVDNLLNKSVVIKTEKSDAFGRYLATIFLDGVDFNNTLLEKGLAVPFKG